MFGKNPLKYIMLDLFDTVSANGIKFILIFYFGYKDRFNSEKMYGICNVPLHNNIFVQFVCRILQYLCFFNFPKKNRIETSK